MNKKRNQQIDIIKGLGIISIVFFHASAPGGDFLNLYFIAVFFMASGYCYKDFQKYDKKEIMEFVIKRVKRLYLPYVLYNVFLLIMHNFFVEINIYTDNPLFVLNENCCGELMSYTEL